MKISEVPGALTLEQLEQMDGQRVLVPETELICGGWGTVNVTRKHVGASDGSDSWWFRDYGKWWVAVKDSYGILEGELWS